jgi:hypothetical protein
MLYYKIKDDKNYGERLKSLGIGLRNFAFPYDTDTIFVNRIIYYIDGTIGMVIGDNAKLILNQTYASGSFASIKDGKLVLLDKNLPGVWWSYINKRLPEIKEALLAYKNKCDIMQTESIEKYFI